MTMLPKLRRAGDKIKTSAGDMAALSTATSGIAAMQSRIIELEATTERLQGELAEANERNENLHGRNEFLEEFCAAKTSVIVKKDGEISALLSTNAALEEKLKRTDAQNDLAYVHGFHAGHQSAQKDDHIQNTDRAAIERRATEALRELKRLGPAEKLNTRTPGMKE